MKTKKSTKFIVGVGASAGGLEAIIKLLQHLPQEEKNFSIIIAQHLSPDYESKMVNLLNQKSAWEVEKAVDSQSPESGKVYVTPPNCQITIRKGKIQITATKRTTQPLPSVDDFFKSLAEELGPQAIGVILSGTGEDGSQGAYTLKIRNAYVIVQDIETAQFGAMPDAVIRSGFHHEIRRPEEIAASIQDRIRELTENPEKKDLTIYKILSKLAEKTGTDFGKYKINTIHRRLQKRLQALNLKSEEEYLGYIDKKHGELDKLFKTVLIGVTEFFRDQQIFEQLRKHVTQILSNKRKGDNIRIWSVGCASGEEPYSLAILLAEILKEDIEHYRVQIFATDIEEEALAVARRGKYPESALNKLPEKIRQTYFQKVDDQYEIKKVIRQMVMFSRHDITNDPPFVRLDLISCRNLLIYFDNELQREAIRTFHYSLLESGYLLLGKSENISQLNDLFERLDKGTKIFKRKTGSQVNSLHFTRFGTRHSNNRKDAKLAGNRGHSLTELAYQTIAQTFEHPFMIVNESMDIVEIRGSLQPYLDLSEGMINANALKVLNNDLHLELRTLFSKVRRNGLAARSNIIRFEVLKTTQLLRLQVKLMLSSLNGQNFYLIIFENLEDDFRIPSYEEIDLENNEKAKLRIMQLEEELEVSKEHLQTFTEELEKSNEELQSLNEELQSTNEELKSSNEELETSNEELQSVNEELEAANAELRQTNEDLITKETELSKERDKLNRLVKRLGESERKLKEAQSIAKIGSWEYDLASGKINWSEGMYQIYEWEPNTPVTLDRVTYYLDEYDQQTAQKVLEEGIQQGETFQIDTTIRTQGGKIKNIQSINKPIKNKQGEVIKLYGTTMDVTELYEKERKLQESEYFLKISQKIAQVGGWLWDLRTNEMECSEEYLDILEIEDENRIKYASDVLDFVHPDDIEATTQATELSREEQRPVPHEFRIITAKGKEKIVYGTGGHNITDQQGRAIKMLGIIQDITQLRQQQTKIKESERKLRLMTENMQDIVFLYDMEQHLQYINPAFKKITGYDTSILDHQNLVELAHEEDQPKMREAWKQVFQGEEIKEEFRIVCKAQKIRWIVVIWEPAFDQAGAQIGVQGRCTEITKEKEAREALLQTKQDLEAALRVKEDFVSIMSHEIRTPLNVIVGMSHLLSQEKLGERNDELVQAVQYSSENLLYLINDILDFSKIQADKLRLEHTSFNLHETIEKSHKMFKLQVSDKNLKYPLEINLPDPLWVMGDPVRLQQILNNLLSNAIKFTSEGEVSLKVERLESEQDEKAWIQFAVKDTGIGISSKRLESIFEPFEQESTSTSREYGGTGLGLSIVKKLVELQEGSISVESEKGKGTTFRIKIPYQKAKGNRGRAGFKLSEASKMGLKDLNVLYVDDIKSNRMLMEALFEDWKIPLKTVSNGEKGLQEALTRKYNLILMDIHMPGMDGYETVQQIRAEEGPFFQDLKIIMVSASAKYEKEESMVLGNIDGYITKPINPNLLYEQLLAVVYDQKSNAQAVPSDFDFFDDIFGDNAESYREFLEITRQEYQRRKNGIIQALRERNEDELAQIRHKSKAVPESLGLDTFLLFLNSLQNIPDKSDQELEQLIQKTEMNFDSLDQELAQKIDKVDED